MKKVTICEVYNTPYYIKVNKFNCKSLNFRLYNTEMKMTRPPLLLGGDIYG